jgi:hypothetical protein
MILYDGRINFDHGDSMKALLLGSLVLMCSHFTNATQFSVSTEFLTFYAIEDRLDSIVGEDIENKYEIEDSMWVTLSGSHSFSENLHGFLDISSSQQDASNNLKLLASLSNKDWQFRTRRGQFVGQFSQFESNGSSLHQTEEVNTEYFSIDAQYGVFGIRYLDMEAPTVLEYPPTTNLSDLTTTSFDGLDPEFALSAYEVFISYDGFQDALSKSYINPDWYAAARVFLGVGFGTGTLSEAGRTNFEKESGKTLADNKLSVEVVEMEAKVSLAKDFHLGAGSKASLALGYGFSTLIYTGEDDSSFGALNVDQEIYHHGPSITFGMNY